MEFDAVVEAFLNKNLDELERDKARVAAREEIATWLKANGCEVNPGSVAVSLVIRGKYPPGAPPGWEVESWSDDESRIYKKGYFTIFVDSA